jgi:tetratricopeptide (TPR) repeat protein
MSRSAGRAAVAGGSIGGWLVPVAGRVPELLEEGTILARKKSIPKAKPQKISAATPRAKALALVDKAFKSPSEEKYFQLLQQALAVDPDCVEARLELARSCMNIHESVTHLEQAVDAGRRLAGDRLRLDFDRGAEPIWMDLACRPYMQAVCELGMASLSLNDNDRARDLFDELLVMNPNDSQGVRYERLHLAIELGEFEVARTLIETYPEPIGQMASGVALYEFAQGGDSPAARAAVKALRKVNKYLVDTMVDFEPFGTESIESYMIGTREEALVVANAFRRSWSRVPGAIAWLREQRINARKSPHPKPVGPNDANVARLTDLPDHTPGVWEVGTEQMPTWILEGKRDLVRPWHITLMDSHSGACLDHDVRTRVPTAEYLFDRILKAATRPLAGDPGKPQFLRVHPAPFWRPLEQPLRDAGIQIEYHETLENLDYASQAVRTAILRESNAPSLMEMPGMTEQRARSFFDAAAEYYRRKPWTRLRCLEPQFELSCTRFDSGPWTGMLIGAAGISTAVGLMPKPGTDGGSGAARDRELPNFLLNMIRQTSMIQVCFGEPFDMLPPDLDAAERLGFEIATPEAYPQVGMLQGGDLTRSLLTWELELLEACLRALPDFCERFPGGETTGVLEVDAVTASGTLPIKLRWLADEELTGTALGDAPQAEFEGGDLEGDEDDGSD